MSMIPDLYPMGGNADEKRLPSLWTNKDWIAERKYDGARYLIRKEMDGSVNVTSRQESKKTGRPVDKTQNVPHLVEMMKNVPNGTILDGEIITSLYCTSSEVTGIMGCDADKAITRQKKRGFVKFVAYDILYVDGQSVMDEPWHYRRTQLEKIVEYYIGVENNNIVLSMYVSCDRHDVKRLYEDIVESGGEGIMLKNRNGKYICGKKPANNWVKVKRWITADVIITGYKPAIRQYTGKELQAWEWWEANDGSIFKTDGKKSADMWAENIGLKVEPVTKYYAMSWIGSIIFSQYDSKGNLLEVGSCSGMDEEIREFISTHQEECLGRIIEVKAMERIKKTMALRHPEFYRWREDKSPEQCVIGEF